MRGSKAKELRKLAGFHPQKVPQVIGEKNITVGSGNATQVINVQTTEPIAPTKELIEARKRYKILKKQYYSNK